MSLINMKLNEFIYEGASLKELQDFVTGLSDSKVDSLNKTVTKRLEREKAGLRKFETQQYFNLYRESKHREKFEELVESLKVRDLGDSQLVYDNVENNNIRTLIIDGKLTEKEERLYDNYTAAYRKVDWLGERKEEIENKIQVYEDILFNIKTRRS